MRSEQNGVEVGLNNPANLMPEIYMCGSET